MTDQPFITYRSADKTNLYHPMDIAEGWCANCSQWTSDPADEAGHEAKMTKMPTWNSMTTAQMFHPRRGCDDQS